MVLVRIYPAKFDHAIMMADYIRDADREELRASSGQIPLLAMRSAIRYSDVAMTGFADGVPVCMWGVTRESLIGNIGVPWMIATERLEKHARLFIRKCRKPLMEMRKEYDILTNYVDARNTRAIRWLEWMGFKIHDPKPYGVLNLPFHKFEMKRG